MAKKKHITELDKEGYKLVPNTAGRILDSVWHNEELQILKIKFASGGTLTFKPLEESITTQNNK